MKKCIFVNDSDNLPESISKSVIGSEVSDKVELLRKLSELGLNVFIDDSYPDDEVTQEYGVGFSYEINIIPFTNLEKGKVRTLQFITPDFDDEEIERLIEVDCIKEIYEKDVNFRKLIDQVRVVDANWDTVLNYLNSTYSFEFKIIHYTDDKDS
jgi:hypothetical protein